MNDMNVDVGDMVSKVTDDTKIDEVAERIEDNRPQDNINVLVKWLFNLNKSEMMYFGSTTEARRYALVGKVLERIEEQR